VIKTERIGVVRSDMMLLNSLFMMHFGPSPFALYCILNYH